MTTAYAELERRFAEYKDVKNGLSILSWDQEVMMPPGGAEARSHALATLTGVAHAKITDPELRKIVKQLSRKGVKLSPAKKRAVQLVRDAVTKASAIPAELAEEIARQESRSLETWRKAREADDWKAFVPDLKRMVELKREVARLTAGKGPLYDALLDDFEPGATAAQVDPLLGRLKEITVPLLRHVVKNKKKVGKSIFVGRFDVEAQARFARDVALSMGIDPARSRMDLSTHPFCGGVGPDDVRMTSRYDRKDMRGGLFGVIHEAGHGLYEQGLESKRLRSPLGGAVSMAVHESQSRLWENNVGRSRAFWTHWLPRLRKAHPQLKGLTLDQVWKAANAMGPSMIRVEADELTYNLHIILRYELERDLVEGRLEVRHLRDAWNETMKELLGVTPRNDAEGVLQDIHWAMGLFGYFPTYSLGNLYAAQFMDAARKAIRGLDGQVAKGRMTKLRDWLRDSIHRHDSVYTPEQLCKRVTGKPLSVEPFERYITAKVEAVYG